MSINAGRRGAGLAGVESLTTCLEDARVPWDFIFVSESDGSRSQSLQGGVTTKGHAWHRHWPGPGSGAMLWIVNRARRREVYSIEWLGRAGRLVMKTSPNKQQTRCFVTMVGVHGPHPEDEYLQTLTQATALARSRPRPSPLLMVGDWNADQLPAMASDPWSDRPRRGEHHAEERQMLASMCQALGIHIHTPDEVLSFPTGPFAEEAMKGPITRTPQGQACQTDIPALLDYAAASPNFIENQQVSLNFAPADHAWIFIRTAPVHCPKKTRRSRASGDPRNLTRQRELFGRQAPPTSGAPSIRERSSAS